MRFSLLAVSGILLYAVITPAELFADLPAACPIETGRWAHGPSRTVAAHGSLGVYGSGAVLRVVDLSTPTTPFVLGEVALPDVVHGVGMDGRYAYVAAGDAGLRVIDLIDPSDPIEVGFATYGDVNHHSATDAVVHDDIVFVLGNAGVILFDVSVPDSPAERGSFAAGNFIDVRSLSVQDTVFAVVFYDVTTSLIHFVDFSNPDAPQQISTFEFYFGGQHYGPCALVWVGDYVYVSEWNSVLFVVDASNPAAPQYVGMDFSGGAGEEMIVTGDVLVLLSRYGSVRLFDISDPSNPTYLLWFDGISNLNDVCPIGSGFLASSEGGGFSTVDLSTPSTPVVISQVTGIGPIRDLVVTGDTAYVSAENAGLVILEVPRPGIAIEMGRIPASFPGALDIADFTAYISTTDGFLVIDVADPSLPATMGSLPGGSGRDLAAFRDIGVLPSGEVAEILDLSIPTAPQSVGVCERSGSATHVEILRDHAYVRFGHGATPTTYGLVTCDVSNPAAPFTTSDFNIDDGTTDMLVAGDHLIVADTSGVETFDLADPTTPSYSGRLSFDGDPGKIDSLANLLFVTDTSYLSALSVVDIADPSNPSLVCSIPVQDVPTAVSVSGGQIYVGFESSGIQVFGYPELVFVDGFERGDTRHWN